MNQKFFLSALFVFSCGIAGAQGILKGSGIIYSGSIPAHSVDTLKEAEIALDVTSGNYYQWSRDSSKWVFSGFKVEIKPGSCSAPTYIPGRNQSYFVSDTCGTFYFYNAGLWRQVKGTIADGDKGDITVSGNGSIWNIDAGAVGATELASTAVAPGTYSNATVTVDADGRITNAVNGPTGARGIYDGSGTTGDFTVVANIQKEIEFRSDSTDASFLVDFTPNDLYGTNAAVRPDSLNFLFFNLSGSSRLVIKSDGISAITNTANPSLRLTGNSAIYSADYSPFTDRELPDYGAVKKIVVDSVQVITVTNDTAYLSRSGGIIPLKKYAQVIDTFLRSGDTLFLSLSNDNAPAVSAIIDGSLINEGSLTVGAGTATTSVISSNTSGSTNVTIEAGSNITLSESGNTITIASTAAGVTDGDKDDITVSGSGANWNIRNDSVTTGKILNGSILFEDIGQNSASNGQVIKWNGSAWAAAADNTGGAGSTDLSWTGASSPYTLNSSSGTDVGFAQGSGITLSTSSSTLTIAAVDQSATNEVLTISDGTNSEVLGGQTLTVAGSGINTASYNATTNTLTITGTESDGSATNEGSLTVGAGTATTSVISSNTSGSTNVTIEAGSNITLSESGNTITIASTAAGVTDGDKDDITVSGSGANWNIRNDSVTTAKIFNGTILFEDIGQNSASNGQVIKWNGSAWAAAADNTGTDGNGIYGGDGDVATNTDATLPTNSFLRFEWPSGNTAFIMDDFGDTVYLADPSLASSVLVSASKVGLRSTGNIELWGGTGGAKLRMLEPTGSGANFTQIQVGAQSADITYTLPATTGSNGQYLQFTTGGQLQWSTVAAGVTDGDKDDITVSGSGANWNIRNDSVTTGKILNGSILFEDIGQNSASNGQVIKWNGSAWAAAADNTGGAGSTDLSWTGASSPYTLNSSSGTDVGFAQGSGITLSTSGSTLTIAAVDQSATNEALTISDGTNSEALGGQTLTVAGGGINTASYNATTNTLTITGTESDGSATNEGSLTVGAGTGTTSVISSNTSGSTAVTITASTGLTTSESGNTITLTNSAPDQTVAITGAGISTVTGTYPNFTVTSTEADGSASNEGILGVGAGSGTTATITTNTTTGNAVTIAGAGIVAITETTGSNGGTITITGTEADGSTTNELQTLSTATNTVTLSNSGGSFTIAGAGINTASTSGSTITITGTEVDGSTTNEIQDLSLSGQTLSLSSDATTVTLPVIAVSAGTGISTSSSGGTVTVTNSAPDQTVGITGTGITVVSNYPNFTLTAADQSATNELQTIANTSDATSHTVTLSNSGGSVQLIEGAGINLTTGGTSGAGTVTIAATNSGTVTSVGITAPAAGITVSNSPITTSGSITLALANDLNAVEGLSANGIAVRTATDTWAIRSIAVSTDAASTAALSVGAADGVSGNPTVSIRTSASTVKLHALVATTGNITLSGTQSIDGINLFANNRVLVKNQNTASENGIWVVSSGAWSRATDLDVDDELNGGVVVYIRRGTTNGGKYFRLTTSSEPGMTINSTALTFSEIFNGFALTDGDKGDITVSGSGATWTIDADVVDSTNVGNKTLSVDDINGAWGVQTGSVLKWNGTNWRPGTDETGGGGVSDGDKGDITVSGSGATWTIDADVVDSTNVGSKALSLNDLNGEWGAAAGTPLEWNGTNWRPGVDSSGIYSGSGNVPNNAIANVLGYFGFQYDTGDGEAIAINNTGGTSRISSPDGNTYALVENDTLTIESDTKVKLVANTLDASGVTNFIGFPSGGGSGFTPQVNVYGTAGTYSLAIPSGATMIEIVCIGGGGGGGSGRRGDNGNNRFGGGGGAGGGYSSTTIRAADVTGPLSVIVGAGGAGGSAVTTDNTNGSNGANGNQSRVDSNTGVILAYASPGNGGSGGTSTSGNGAGTSTNGTDFGQSQGGAGSSSIGSAGGGSPNKPPSGGGGGSGLNTSNSQASGANGGAWNYSRISQSNAGTTSVPNGGAGGTPTQGQMVGGGGGGGGASQSAAAAGNGGAGTRGGGGGGGGASASGFNSGAGGNGGAGYVRVVFY